MSDLTRLNPTPHAIAVYASQPLSPVATQHSLPSRTLPFTWAGLSPAGSHQLAAGAPIRSPRRRGSVGCEGRLRVHDRRLTRSHPYHPARYSAFASSKSLMVFAAS